MAVLLTAFLLIGTVQQGLGGEIPDMILYADATCSPDTTGITTVSVVSDHFVDVIVDCKDNQSFNVPRIEETEFYNATVKYTGDSSESCTFKKKLNSEVYQVDVEVIYNDGVERIIDVFRVSCTYDPYHQGVSMKEITESLKPPKQLETHLGHQSMSTFTMEIQDVYGKALTEDVKFGRKIRLFITMTPSSGNYTEQSFKVLHCDGLAAGSSGMKYGFLRSGCGDGYVIGKDKGFITEGLTAASPYFKAFRLFGSNSVSFKCKFITCAANCDGNSCAFANLKKRVKRSDINQAVEQKINDIKKEELSIKSNAIRIVPDTSKTRKTLIKTITKTFHQTGNILQSPGSAHSETKSSSAASSKTTRTDMNTTPATHIPNRSMKSQKEAVKLRISSKQVKLKKVLDSDVTSEMEKDASKANFKKSSKSEKGPSVSMTIRTKTDMDKGLNSDQIGAIVGCVSFILVVGLFLCVTLWHIHQKKAIESKYRAYRFNDTDSKTSLLNNEQTDI